MTILKVRCGCDRLTVSINLHDSVSKLKSSVFTRRDTYDRWTQTLRLYLYVV